MGGRSVDIPITDTTTVADIKADVETELEVAAVQQKLLLKGKPLLDAKPISHYGIADGSSLTLVVLKQRKKKGGSGSGQAQNDAVTCSQPATHATPASAAGKLDRHVGAVDAPDRCTPKNDIAAKAAAERAVAAKGFVREVEQSLEALGAGPPLEWGGDSSAEEQLALCLAGLEKQLGGEIKTLMSAAVSALEQADATGDQAAVTGPVAPLRHLGAAMQNATNALGHIVTSTGDDPSVAT